MNILKTLALLVTFASVPAFEQGNAVSGPWKVSGEVAGTSVDGVCNLTQDGKKLSGSCVLGSSSQSFEVTGEVQDKKVSWKFNSEYGGQALTTTFSGTMDDAGAQLKGTIDVQPIGMSGDFTAKKDEPKKGQ